jgi:hypothetical protein
MNYVARTICRVCSGHGLTTILDLGKQALQGQFPAADEPDPPMCPLDVAKCDSCGLVQLRHTVDPNMMFRSYFYRSGVSQTMRDHLKQLAEESVQMLGAREGPVCIAPRILDIGGNDGWTLDCISVGTGQRVLIDPSNVPVEYPGIMKITGYFPQDMLLDRKFDLVFSAACFYDANDPVSWATGVRKVLSPYGLWCVEVADLRDVYEHVAFDYWCHEHSMLLSPLDMEEIAKQARLKVVRIEKNKCNGGSARYYLTHVDCKSYDKPEWSDSVTRHITDHITWAQGPVHERFAERAKWAIDGLKKLVAEARAEGKTIHILGASTKGNVIWQAAGLTTADVAAASDRDPRKDGRRLPGTNIPIVVEEASRILKPDIYLCPIVHFREEVLRREAEYLKAGGKIVFPLPTTHTYIHDPKFLG